MLCFNINLNVPSFKRVQLMKEMIYFIIKYTINTTGAPSVPWFEGRFSIYEADLSHFHKFVVGIINLVKRKDRQAWSNKGTIKVFKWEIYNSFKVEFVKKSILFSLMKAF